MLHVVKGQGTSPRPPPIFIFTVLERTSNLPLFPLEGLGPAVKQIEWLEQNGFNFYLIRREKIN